MMHRLNNHVLQQFANQSRSPVTGEVDLASFAELIVKECGAIQHKRFCEHGDVWYDLLLNHFGIPTNDKVAM